MNAPVVGVSPIASVPRIVALLRMNGHNGFPVLAPPEDLGADAGGGSGILGLDGRLQQPGGRKPRAPRRLLGMILRSQLQVLLERGALCDAEGALHLRSRQCLPVTLHPNCPSRCQTSSCQCVTLLPGCAVDLMSRRYASAPSEAH